MLKIDSAAPEFSLTDHNNNTFTIDLSNWNFLWWYPKASTPTCTQEGCSLRNMEGEFGNLGCKILGISYDTPEDNKKFATEQNFGYGLLSDIDREVSKKYEVVRDPSDEYAEMPLRISYLISPEGKIAAAYEVTDAPSHASEVLEDLKKLQSKN